MKTENLRFVVIEKNYAEGQDAYIFRSLKSAEIFIKECLDAEKKSLMDEGYTTASVNHAPFCWKIYVPDVPQASIYYEWEIVLSEMMED